MKKPNLITAILVMLLGVTAVIASGPGPRFDDLPFEMGDVWFYDSVYDLKAKTIVKGFPDNTYRPTANVNRAEMAVMLENTLNYIEHPMGENWETYSNNFYTVWYPTNPMNDQLSTVDYFDYFGDECESAMSGLGDVWWQIQCFKKSETTLNSLLAVKIGVVGASEIRQLEEEMTINGRKATRVVRLMQDVHAYFEEVIIEGDDRYFVLSNGKGPDFERFYTSFKVK